MNYLLNNFTEKNKENISKLFDNTNTLEEYKNKNETQIREIQRQIADMAQGQKAQF